MADRATVHWGQGGRGVDLLLGDRIRVRMNAAGATWLAASLDHLARQAPSPDVEIRDHGVLLGTVTRGRAMELARDIGFKAAVDRMVTRAR